ncbi:MAG: hypothetical protein GY841_20655 [FCB group bacterium]|nr:hypothetical protein [FCB group bacterium]
MMKLRKRIRLWLKGCKPMGGRQYIKPPDKEHQVIGVDAGCGEDWKGYSIFTVTTTEGETNNCGITFTIKGLYSKSAKTAREINK